MKAALLFLTITAFSLAPSLRAEDPAPAPINPALLYWQAAAELPNLTTEQAGELRAIASGQKPFDAKQTEGIPNVDRPMHLVRRAAESPAPCDWGLPLEEGPLMAVSHIPKMYEMANLSMLRAETLFAQGHAQEGREWLLTTHRLARHVGANDLLLSNLLQLTIESMALRGAARHCLSWDEETRLGYAAALAHLSPLHPTAGAFRGERSLPFWVESQVTAGGDALRQAEEVIRSMLAMHQPSVEKEALAAQSAPTALLAATTEMRSLQPRIEAALGLPWPQGHPALQALAEEVNRSPQVLVRTSLADILSVGDKPFTVATLRLMLEAALQHGPRLDEATAATYRDAFGGEPLRWKKGEAGAFILYTAQQHPEGRGVSLPFGK